VRSTVPKLLLIAATIFLRPQAMAQSTVQQADIDNAFALILRTSVGQTVCTRILGADAEALVFHLGISPARAAELAAECRPGTVPDWLYPTTPADIRKLTLSPAHARQYRFVSTDRNDPIESWTDPFSNTTVILNRQGRPSASRLVEVLAHEMAVYFDSKANPAQPDAGKIPQLAGLRLRPKTWFNPLLALANPLTAHTLTFVRALIIERRIVTELVERGLLAPPDDFSNPYLRYLVSDACSEACLEQLVVNMRRIYLPLALPLLAFQPQYRAMALNELPRMQAVFSPAQWARAQAALVQSPVEFLKTQFSGDSLADLQSLYAEESTRPNEFAGAARFLQEDLWPLEQPALFETRVEGDDGTGETLLEFMKRPLLSGYNILLSSGPRVRIRPGTVE
jgi:hypothetical protein